MHANERQRCRSDRQDSAQQHHRHQLAIGWEFGRSGRGRRRCGLNRGRVLGQHEKVRGQSNKKM
jgi:hypothetical protein